MKLTIITDAWETQGQLNGVVTTLSRTVEILKNKGYEITIIHPDLFFGFSLPNYKEIKMAFNLWKVGKLIEDSKPESIHIVTEGPLGIAARVWCSFRNYRFTTSYHTRFPEYAEERIGFGADLSYQYLRWFHNKSGNTMVNTPSMLRLLESKGFENLVLWGRGVDTDLFKPDGPKDDTMVGLSKPVWLNVGRVSIEKNLEEFYNLDLPGSKVQVGSGPMLEKYKDKYPDVFFLGQRRGEELAECYRSADYFVFPSITDTFGLVILESLASGVPVAALPATGPSDILIEGKTGIIKENLKDSCEEILKMTWNKEEIRKWALGQSWEKYTEQFEQNLVLI